MPQWYSSTDLQISSSRRRPVRNSPAVVPASACLGNLGSKGGLDGVQFLRLRGLINLRQDRTEGRLPDPGTRGKQALPLHRGIPAFQLKRKHLSMISAGVRFVISLLAKLSFFGAFPAYQTLLGTIVLAVGGK